MPQESCGKTTVALPLVNEDSATNRNRLRDGPSQSKHVTWDSHTVGDDAQGVYAGGVQAARLSLNTWLSGSFWQLSTQSSGDCWCRPASQVAAAQMTAVRPGAGPAPLFQFAQRTTKMCC